MKAIARIGGFLFVAALIAGCPLVEERFPIEEEPPPEEEPAPESGFGTLEIDFGSLLRSARTLNPTNMTVSRWDIAGTLQGGSHSFTGSAGPQETFSQSALLTGSWTITVDGVNPDGIVIGHGETLAEIEPGETTTANVRISLLPGNGTLDLKINWGKKDFESDRILASISPAIADSTTLDFTYSEHALVRTGAYRNKLVPAGYYLLSIQLEGDGVVVWGVTEAVRIVAGLTTEEEWTYPSP